MPLEQQTVPDAQSEQHGEPTQEIEDTEDSAVVVNEEDEKTVQKFESKELEYVKFLTHTGPHPPSTSFLTL